MTQCPVKPIGKLGVPEVLINIVRSFHENMTAQIQLDGELSEGIDVNNDLRQGLLLLQRFLTCILAWLLNNGAPE